MVLPCGFTTPFFVVSLSPPAFRERRHRCLARRCIAMCGRATFVMPEGECPHPRRAYGRGGGVEDAANDNAICKHVKVVLAPLAGCAGSRGAFENEIVLLHRVAAQSGLLPGGLFFSAR